MRFIASLLAVVAATGAQAQQELYACTENGVIVRVLDYASSPDTRILQNGLPFLLYVMDIAVRPNSGAICATDPGVGIDLIWEFDPTTGQIIGMCSVFVTQAWAIDCDSTGSLVGQRWDNLPSVLFAERAGQCVDVPMASTLSLNQKGLATESPGTMLSLRAASTIIERIDRTSGAVLGAYDTGLSFEGIEVDTDGSIYGLTLDGTIWDVSLSPPLASPIGVLHGPGLADRWSGLAFRYAPLDMNVQAVCDGLVNSAGQIAGLVMGDPQRAGSRSLGLRVDGLPPGHTAVMIFGTSAGSRPLGAGVLCIGSTVAHLPNPAAADASGTARYLIDLDMFPAHGAVMSGDSYVFQCLYRDTASIHFSSATNITFL